MRLFTGLAVLVIFQLIGIWVSAHFHTSLPAAVISMLLLLICLTLAKLPKSVETTAVTLLGYLPLFILPASAGILAHLEVLEAKLWPMLLAIVVSSIVSFLLIPHIFRYMEKVFPS